MLWLLLFNGWTSCLAMPALSLKNITQENFSRGSSFYPLCCVCKMFQVLSLWHTHKHTHLLTAHTRTLLVSSSSRQSNSNTSPHLLPAHTFHSNPWLQIIIFLFFDLVSEFRIKNWNWFWVLLVSIQATSRDRWIKRETTLGLLTCNFFFKMPQSKTILLEMTKKLNSTEIFSFSSEYLEKRKKYIFAKIDWLLRKSIPCDVLSFPGHFLAV